MSLTSIKTAAILAAMPILLFMSFSFKVGHNEHLSLVPGCITSGNQQIAAGNIPDTISASPASGGICGSYNYQGNVMAVYRWAASTNVPKLAEWHLYGSSRLGIISGDTTIHDTTNLATNFGIAIKSKFIRGLRAFELTNHLGNVLATISDRKIQHNSSGFTDYYTADIISATDYYPFGMQMPGRNYSSTTYRYGFNGKENDNDIKGSGNQQDYGFRIYDPRLGKFLSVDPLTEKYAKLSPYQFASNRPILMIDYDGLEGSLGFNGSAMVLQPAYSLVEFDSDGDYKPDYGQGWAAGALFTFTGGAIVLTGGRAIPILREATLRLATNPKTIALFTTASSAAAKYGPDAGNFAYGLFTGDATEPIPSPNNSQASDVGVAFRNIFRAPVNPVGWLKGVGSEMAVLTKGTNNKKVAVIGQGMDRVKRVAEGLNNPEIFKPSEAAQIEWNQLLSANKGKQISNDVVQATKMYKENVDWINDVKKEGYDILDIGGNTTSTFYQMEKQAVYGTSQKSP